MKKIIYVVLGLFLLAPILATRPAHKPVARYTYVFTYTATLVSGNNWDITVYFDQYDSSTNTVTGMTAPAGFVLYPSSGPLAGQEVDFPYGTGHIDLGPISYPGGPTGTIPGTTTPTVVNGENVYQGFPPLSDL